MSHSKPQFYQHLHAFRGFAIINIVAAHTWIMLLMILTQGDIPTELKQVSFISESLFHNATIYFAIISGLLYSLVLQQYSWKKFYLGKLKNVVSPYILFSIILSFLGAMVLVPPGSEVPTALEVLQTIPLNILTGSSFGHMWYIPVLIVLFVLTPLLSYVVKTEKLWPILILLIVAPVFISRSWPDVTWKNFVFFIGPYCLGLLVGSHYQLALKKISQYSALIIGCIIIATPILYFLYVSEYDLIYDIKLQESVGYVHKLLIAAIVLKFMANVEEKLPKFLSKLGDYSFSIYFTHMVFLIIIGVILITVGVVTPNLLSIFLWGFPVLVLAIFVSIGFAKLIKLTTGKRSRMFIGS